MCKFNIVEINGNKVVGYNGDFTITVGEIFEFVKQYRYPENLVEWKKEPELIKSTPIFLKVIAIKAYDKDLEDLGPGMSGELTLEGKGLEELCQDSILETDELRPEYDFLEPAEKGKYAAKYKLKQLEEEIRKVLSGYIGDPVSLETQEKYAEEIISAYKKLFGPNIEFTDDGSTKNILKLKISATFDGIKEN